MWGLVSGRRDYGEKNCNFAPYIFKIIAKRVTLYPFTFHTIYKEKVWGGSKLHDLLGKNGPYDGHCGESWEVSALPDNVSTVKNGPLAGTSLTQLVQQYKQALLGNKVWQRYGASFPLLVKFIDANQDLSIQVHPNDALASQRHNSFGKSEMWYIMQADEGAALISGFSQPLNEQEYTQALHQGQLTTLLNKEAVQPGDVFYIPAGRVHTIGQGILLAEIQQSADITYRLYDFDRVGLDGKKRALHTEQALAAIDFNHYPNYRTEYPQNETSAQLVQQEHFSVNLLSLDKPTPRSYHSLDSFVVLLCVQGQGVLHYGGQSLEVPLGAAVLVPAAQQQIELVPTGQAPFKLLESYMV